MKPPLNLEAPVAQINRVALMYLQLKVNTRISTGFLQEYSPDGLFRFASVVFRGGEFPNIA